MFGTNSIISSVVVSLEVCVCKNCGQVKDLWLSQVETQHFL